MSSYPTWEAVNPGDTSYLSVTCSVTATATMNTAPRGWSIDTSNNQLYTNQGMTHYSDMNNSCYPCGDPPNPEPDFNNTQFAPFCAPENLLMSNGAPDLDLQTEYSWSNFYPGLERTDQLASMDGREERQCIWMDGEHLVSKEASGFFDRNFKPFVAWNSATEDGLECCSYVGPENCGVTAVADNTADLTELHTANVFETPSAKMRHHEDFADRKVSEWDLHVPENETSALDSRSPMNIRSIEHVQQLPASEMTMGDNCVLIRSSHLAEDWLQKSHLNERGHRDVCENNHKKYPLEATNTDVHRKNSLMTLSAEKGCGDLRETCHGDVIEKRNAEVLRCSNEIKKTSPAKSFELMPEVKELVDVDHMISSGVTVAGYKPRNIIRKRAKSAVPKSVKDICYWEKRKKNNESARRSREMKKEKEKHFYRRALELEYENLFLKERIGFLETKLSCSSNPTSSMG